MRLAEEWESGEIELAFLVLADDELENYDQAMKSMDGDKWKIACQKEIDTLQKYNTWELVSLSPDINIIESHWAFRVKWDNLGKVNVYKVRLVAQGFSQMPGIDFNQTYSPTIRMTSIRFILAIACQYNLKLRQVDVKGAYLNGVLEEDIYMR